jgi:hypothetical protein
MQSIFSNKKRNKSWKFWVLFWAVAGIFLLSWGIYWKFQQQGATSFLKYLRPLVNWSSLEAETKDQLKTFLDVAADFLEKGTEKDLLIIFQNPDQLKPGGGKIEALAQVRFKGEKISSVEFLDIASIKESDFKESDDHTSQISDPSQKGQEGREGEEGRVFPGSNLLYPDFAQSASLISEELSSWEKNQGDKNKEFSPDAVVAISNHSLKDLLEILGPLEVTGWKKKINSGNVLESLRGNSHLKQQISQGRLIVKEEFFNLEEAIWKKIWEKFLEASWEKKARVIEQLNQEIKEKDLMIYFSDQGLQSQARGAGWTASIDKLKRREDYLLIVDTNLNSIDNDRLIRRSFQYQIDLTQQPARAQLTIFYQHHGRLRNEFASDYYSYLRAYLPPGSQLIDSNSFEEVETGEEEVLKRSYFATDIMVPLGKSKKITFDYELPWENDFKEYSLKIQKQPGIEQLTGEVKIIGKNGRSKTYQVKSKKDVVIEVVKEGKD